MGDDVYRLYAIKYGTHHRKKQDNFTAPVDLHDEPTTIDYFVWTAVSDTRTFVIDTGFDHVAAKARGRDLFRLVDDGLRLIGIEASEVEDVIITHMHYDHGGNVDMFPKATFHIQDLEMSYVTGRHMRHPYLRNSYNVDDVIEMVRALYGQRVTFHDGDAELAPGLSVHLIGGHTMGLQSVRVNTQRGWVVVASDAMHLYDNRETGNPFPIIYKAPDMMAGWETLRGLADSEDHLVPGHDPQVMQRYPAVSDELEGIAIRLDVDPT